MLRRQGAREQLDLTAVWFTSEDARERPFPLRRFFLPWAQPAEPTGGAESWVAGDIPELEGGSWHRGRAVFFGEQANCSKCHQLQGTGGHIGPDLSNLSHRDYHSVLRDIVHPSFAINPDHLAYTIMLSDGQVLTGLVRQEEGQLIVGTTKAEEVRIDPKEVERMVPATISIMPTGIDEALGPDKLRDLMFLLGTSPSMPNDRAAVRHLDPEPRQVPRWRVHRQPIAIPAPCKWYWWQASRIMVPVNTITRLGCALGRLYSKQPITLWSQRRWIGQSQKRLRPPMPLCFTSKANGTSNALAISISF
ncbi:MAG: c-type cytochrome [Pirellulaceae bacterium]